MGLSVQGTGANRLELLRALRETVAGWSVLDPIIVDALVGRRASPYRSS
jgi:hypothetical protein